MRDAHGMEVGNGMVDAGKGNVKVGGQSAAQGNDIDEMQKKLDQLKHL